MTKKFTNMENEAISQESVAIDFGPPRVGTIVKPFNFRETKDIDFSR